MKTKCTSSEHLAQLGAWIGGDIRLRSQVDSFSSSQRFSLELTPCFQYYLPLSRSIYHQGSRCQAPRDTAASCGSQWRRQ